jgi:uncharacterized membrane protein
MLIAKHLTTPRRRGAFALCLALLGSACLGACRSEEPTQAIAADTRSSALEPATAPHASASTSSRPVASGVAARPPATRDEPIGSLRVTGVAAGDVLNIRSRPDGDSEVIGSIPPNATGIEGLAPPDAVGQPKWQKVRFGNTIGWVNARFVEANGGINHSRPAQPAAATAPPNTASALSNLACFGNEPYWMIEFGIDGSATCTETCEGPPGLRVSGLETSPRGEPELFDIVTAKGTTYLRAVMKRTDQCSDGMSDARHPYMFSAVGDPGELTGCCRVKK